MPDDKKTKGHKSRFFIKLFRGQQKAKLSDEQLAKAAEKEYPDSRDWLKSMPGLRNYYNRGGFSGQDGAPSRPVPQYVKGAAVSKRSKPAPKPSTKPAAKKKSTKKTETKATKKKATKKKVSGPAASARVLKAKAKKKTEPAPADTTD